LGGTRDPVDHGHLVTAEAALWKFHLDQGVFVPTGRPWMKEEREVAPAEHRYLMTVIATASNPRFSVSRVEVDREGPTYTIDTLRAMKELFGADLFFITGADAVLEIFQWKDPSELFEMAHFIAATRPGYDIAALEEQVPGHDGISNLSIPALAISSTDIRARVARGQPIRYLVPEGVVSYVGKAGLYR